MPKFKTDQPKNLHVFEVAAIDNVVLAPWESIQKTSEVIMKVSYGCFSQKTTTKTFN